MLHPIDQPSTSKDTARSAAKLWVALLLFLIISAESLCLFYLFRLGNIPIQRGDGPSYHYLAVNILDYAVLSWAEVPPYEPTMLRTPGYPLFIAASYVIGGRSPATLRIAQLILLGCIAWLLYLLGSHFVTQRAALIAAVLCATYPPYVFISLYYLTEILTTLLAVLSMLLLMRRLDNKFEEVICGLGVGITLGVAALVRPSLALLIVIIVPAQILLRGWSFWRSRIPVAAATAAGFLLCVAPWAMRNSNLAGKFLPFGIGSGWSLFISAQQYSNDLSYRLTVTEWGQILTEHDARAAKAWQVVTAAGPTLGNRQGISLSVQQELVHDSEYAKDGWQKMSSIGLRQIIFSLPARVAYLWSTADFSPWATGLFHRLVQAHYGLLVLLVGLGCYFSRVVLLRHWGLWIIPAYLTLIHLVFHIEPRYSFPGRAFLFVYAGVALEQLANRNRTA